jgi:serine/threonine protein kinase
VSPHNSALPIASTRPGTTGKRTRNDQNESQTEQHGRDDDNALIRAPSVLYNVNAFVKKHQVGQGTYGSVFVGQDKRTKNVVALKRINTEQDTKHGFPITTIREVKLLKALCHENVITLKEIGTSYGLYMCMCVGVQTRFWDVLFFAPQLTIPRLHLWIDLLKNTQTKVAFPKISTSSLSIWSMT